MSNLELPQSPGNTTAFVLRQTGLIGHFQATVSDWLFELICFHRARSEKEETH